MTHRPSPRHRAPLELPCGLELPDRIALAPLTNTQSGADGRLGEDELRWLVSRAEGGFRWVSTCAAWVEPAGRAWAGQLGIAHDDHLPGLRRLATALREAGALAVVQLHHGGAKATLAPGGPIGPSDDGRGARAADEGELERTMEAFADAALRAHAAGFAGVELHGANGYLFTQFLAPADNRRDDCWGGELEGRARLLRHTLQRVRARVPHSFAVGVRLSPIDLYAPRGLRLDDSLQVARWLAEDGADFIHLSLADAAGRDHDGRVVARAFRDALPARVPVFAAGGITSGSELDRALDAGVDVAVVGRAAIAHPDWPRAMERPDFTPPKPPFDPEHLRAVAVGPAFLAYMRGLRGLVAPEGQGQT